VSLMSELNEETLVTFVVIHKSVYLLTNTQAKLFYHNTLVTSLVSQYDLYL